MWKRIGLSLLLGLCVLSWGYSQQVLVDTQQLKQLELIFYQLKQEVFSLRQHLAEQQALYTTLNLSSEEKEKILANLERSLLLKEKLLTLLELQLKEAQQQLTALNISLTSAQQSLTTLARTHLRDILLTGAAGLAAGVLITLVITLPHLTN